MNDKDVLNTGTTTVGFVCKNCLILAADKRATAGNFIANKNVDKVIPIHEKMAVTTSGVVSDIQLLTKLIRAETKLKEIRVNREITVKETANLLGNLIYSNIRRMSMIPGITHFLLGGYDKGLKLYDLYADGSLSKIDDFVASGSGSVFAYGVLETSFKKDMSEEEGIKLAITSINAAMQRDSASGEGIDVYVINNDGVKKAAHKKVNTYAE